MNYKVSTHSRPKAAADVYWVAYPSLGVSTHSRPKAAALWRTKSSNLCNGFNTQPPEGGCYKLGIGGLHSQVSTHSRPKAAACIPCGVLKRLGCFNTQPPEGGCLLF